MIDTKALIESIIKNQSEITALLKELKDSFTDNEMMIQRLNSIDKGFYFNSSIINLLCDTLQMVNDADLLKQFTLQDIEKLYEQNIELNPYDISFYEDLAIFENSVLNNQGKSILIAKKALAIIELKRRTLEDIIKSSNE